MSVSVFAFDADELTPFSASRPTTAIDWTLAFLSDHRDEAPATSTEFFKDHRFTHSKPCPLVSIFLGSTALCRVTLLFSPRERSRFVINQRTAVVTIQGGD